MKMKNQNSIENYFSSKKTKFWSLLVETEKWKELYDQVESKISVVLSLMITGIMVLVYHKSDFNNFYELMSNLLQILIESSVGMLGFIISGLAIFTGTITTRLVKNINSDQKIDSLIGILFSFYFIGAVVGLGIIIYLVTYIFLFSNYEFRLYKLILLSMVCSFLYMFSILYSISLLGTCLRLFLVSFKYSEENEE